MDEWDDVRRIAPGGEPSVDAIAAARAGLLREIADADASRSRASTRVEENASPIRGRKGRVRASPGLAAAASVVLVAGVVALVFGIDAANGPVASTHTTSPTPTAPIDAADHVLCGSTAIPTEAIEYPEFVSDGSRDALAAVDVARAAIDSAIAGMGTEMFSSLDDWIVVRAAGGEALLLREQPGEGTDEGGGEPHAFDDVVRFVRDAEGSWDFVATGGCELVVDLGELVRAQVTLDPAFPLDRDSSRLHLLVNDRECTSGLGAEGRIRIVQVAEDAGAIQLLIGLTPLDGMAQTCVGTLPVPYVVDLGGPVGVRPIWDVGSYEPRRLTPP